MEGLKVGFIGGGMMAEAMIGGLFKGGLPKSSATVTEPDAKRRKVMADQFKVEVHTDNAKLCKDSNVVVMAVKPQVLDVVLQDLADKAKADPEVTNILLISIVAGKTLESFAKYLPNTRVARVMPNTPCRVGAGASAFVLNSLCTGEDAARVQAVMGSCGIVEQVGDEKLLDAVTGVSGSGPAYIYLLIEALSDGGVRQGLPRPIATRLAAQTVMGAGKMVIESGDHPGKLKDEVTSPGGTTIAGVHALELGSFRATAMNAVEAATKRSIELGKL